MKNSKWLKILEILALTAGTVILTPRDAAPTVTNTTTETITALGNGSTTNFTIGFDFRDNSQVTVEMQDNSTSPPTQTSISQGSGSTKFTISGGNPGTTVVMGTAPTTTQFLIIQRAIPLQQPVVYDEASAFPASDHETQMDQMVMMIQDQGQTLNQKVGLSATSASSVPVLPDPVANNFVGYSSSGVMANLPGAGVGISTNDIMQFNGSTWAPVLPGTFSLSGFTGNITNAQLPTTETWPGSGTVQAITPSAHGVLISGAGATATVSGAGISGQVLTSNGASADPTFQNASGGPNSIGSLDSQAGSSNGLVISGSTLYAQSASGTQPGMVNTSAQTFAGAKTLSTNPIFSAMSSSGVVINASSGQTSSVAPGTSGNVLTSNGSVWTSAAASTGTLGSIGTFDGNAASANGLSISGSGIYAQSASASNPGMVNTSSQTLAGAKTFSSAPTFSSLSSSGVIINASSGLVSSVTPGTSGNVLTSNGSVWTSAAAAAGSVTSTTTGAEHIERATIAITGASACSITNQSGSWISSVAASSSICTLTIPTGEWSAAPTCTITTDNTGASAVARLSSAPTATSITIMVMDGSFTKTTGNAYVMCMGPR